MIKNIRTHSADAELIRDRRTHIARCSAKIMMKNGFHRTTLRQITVACNMGMGTLYHYIGSKDDILRLIIDIPLTRLNKLSDEITQMMDSTNYIQVLTAAIDKYFRLVDELQDLWIFNASESKNLPRDTLNELLQTNIYFINIFENILVKGRKAGLFKLDNPRLLARSITTLGNDWAYSRWFFRGEISILEYIEEHTKMILNAIKNRDLAEHA